MLLRSIGMVLVSVAVAGCELHPTPFPTPASDLGNGPGLFTGKTGQATVLRQ